MPNLPDIPFSKGTIVVFLFALFVINGLSFEPTSGNSVAAIGGSSLVLEDITQGYSSRHNGIDIAAKKGSEILSLTKGEVVRVGNEDKYCRGKGYGKFVMVEDKKSNLTFLYAHMQDQFVEEGEGIESLEPIGSVGLTGKTTGPHLHLSIFKTDTLTSVDHACGKRLIGETVNPLNYINS